MSKENTFLLRRKNMTGVQVECFKKVEGWYLSRGRILSPNQVYAYSQDEWEPVPTNPRYSIIMSGGRIVELDCDSGEYPAFIEYSRSGYSVRDYIYLDDLGMP